MSLTTGPFAEHPVVGAAGLLERFVADPVLEALPDAVIVTDATQVVRTWNAASTALYGIAPEAALGRPIEELIRTEPLGRGAGRTLAELAAGGRWHGRIVDVPLEGPLAGRPVVVDFTLSAIVDESGTTIGYLGVNRDVTALDALERAIAGERASGEAQPDVEGLARRALDGLLASTGAPVGAVLLADGPTLRVLVHAGVSERVIGLIEASPLDPTSFLASIAGAGGVLAGPLDRLPLTAEGLRIVGEEGVRSIAAAVLEIPDGPVGVFVLGSREADHRWPPETTLAGIADGLATAIRGARAVDELRHRYEQQRRLATRLESLLEMTRIEQGTEGSGDVAAHVVERLTATLGATAGTIGVETDGRWRVLATAGAGGDPARHLSDGRRRAWERLAAGEEACLDVELPPRPRADGVTALAAIPIRHDGRLTGAALLAFDRPADELEVDIETLAACGRVLSIVFDNQRLRSVLLAGIDIERDLRRRLTVLEELTALGEHANDEVEHGRRTALLVRDALGAAAVQLGVLHADRFERIADTGTHAAFAAERDPDLRGSTPYEHFVAGGGSLFREYRPGGAGPEALARAAEAGYTGYAALPIRLDGRLRAALVAFFDRPFAELGLDEAFLDAVARTIAISLANFDRRDRLEAGLRRERAFIDRLGALQQLTRLGEEASEPRDLAARTLDLVVASLGAVSGGYGLYDAEADRIAILASLDLPPELALGTVDRPASEMEPIRRFLAGGGPYVRAYAPGEASPGSLALAEAHGFQAYAALPVRVEDHLEAAVVVYFERGLDGIEVDERWLAALAQSASISLANVRLRASLERSETRYRTLFSRSPEAYLLSDLETRALLEANDAALRLFALTPDALPRLGLDDLLRETGGPPGGVRALPVERRAVSRGTGVRSDGTTFPYELLADIVEVDGTDRVLTLVRDLTDQERLQQELIQAQKMEAMGTLVAGVAHELNNPLASIIGFSQLIRADPRLPGDMKTDADRLIGEADRTRRIVQNLLDFARQRPPERYPTSLRALVRSVIDLQAYSLRGSGIEVVVDVPDDLPPIEVDRSQMQQVLLNLTLNALQSMRSSGQGARLVASARLVDRGSLVRIVIEDDGPGVPPEARGRLFLPFFTTKPPGEGTGLGLPVSFGIVAAHAGHLWYEPVEGGTGARFCIELPVRAADSDAGRSAGGEAQGADDGPDAPSGARAPGDHAAARARATARRVLVLDDEPAIRDLLRKALRLDACEVVLAGSGAEAVELVRAGPFDAVLCDHRMAGMSGTDVFAALIELRPELARRFVFMSGDVLNPELRSFALEHGVALLAKPFALDAIRRAVREVVAGDPTERRG